MRPRKTIATPHDTGESGPGGDTDVIMSGFQQFLKDTSEEELSGLADTLKHFGVMSLSAIVSEIYSAPRVTAMCTRFGLIPGFVLDLTTIDPSDGQPWDFDKPEKRERERERAQTTVRTKTDAASRQSNVYGV